MDPINDISAALRSVTRAAHLLMSNPAFVPGYVPQTYRRKVTTVSYAHPPKEVPDNPIRGVDDVLARFSDPAGAGHADKTTSNIFAGLLFSAGSVGGGLLTDREAVEPLSRAFANSVNQLVNSILADIPLRVRCELHWRADLPEDIQHEDYLSSRSQVSRNLTTIPLLADVFTTVLADIDPQDADEWREAAQQVESELREFRERESDTYTVRAFINGPLLQGAKVELVGHQVADAVRYELRLIQADDELIAAAFGEGYVPQMLPVGLQTANVAIDVSFRVEFGPHPEDASSVVAFGAELARRVVDVLRIVRPDDIGIGYAHLVRHRWGTRFLPTTDLWTLQDSAAAYTPRRGAFNAPSLDVLSDDEMSQIQGLLSRHIRGVDVAGYRVATRRFRDTLERYLPGDPESLLDAAIALEALYMGDQGTKELRHRLSLRIAKLLGRDLAERQNISRAVKNLYDVRSRIAHGEPVETMKGADARRLADAVAEVPRVLRASMRAFLEGKGPEGVGKGEALAEWWTNIELA